MGLGRGSLGLGEGPSGAQHSIGSAKPHKPVVLFSAEVGFPLT